MEIAEAAPITNTEFPDGPGIVWIPEDGNIVLEVLKPGLSNQKDKDTSWHEKTITGVKGGLWLPIFTRKVVSYTGTIANCLIGY